MINYYLKYGDKIYRYRNMLYVIEYKMNVVY